MKTLFHCAACGFVSTRGSEFRRRGGVMLDKECLDGARAGREPEVIWVAEAIARQEAKTAAAGVPVRGEEG